MGGRRAGPAPTATISLRGAVGKELVVSVADETPWLHNLSVAGDRWLLNYCPHLYQAPDYLPVHDYTQAALAGAHIATLPFKVIQQMVHHPLTDKGIVQFKADWEKARETAAAK